MTTRKHVGRGAVCVPGAALLWSAAAPAQTVTAPPVTVDDVMLSGSIRSRMYSWNWFGGTPNGDSTYSGSLARFGASKSKKAFDWQVEFAAPALVNMPADAVVPAPGASSGSAPAMPRQTPARPAPPASS